MAPDPVQIATLPIRIALRVGRGVLAPVAGAAGQALDIARGLLGDDGAAGAEVTDPRSEATAPAEPEPRAEAPPPLAPREPGTAPDADLPSAYTEPPPSEAPASEEPEHVSEEAVLVAESADPEIADGIHTDLRVDEPWEGYSRQTAADVIAALESASPAEVAVVQLYETTNRGRKTVLEAAARRLRNA